LDYNLDLINAIKKVGASTVGYARFNGQNAIILSFPSTGRHDLSKLDEHALSIVRIIQKKGFYASVIGAADGGGISLRDLAVGSGMGFIGKSGLLISGELGPRQRLVGILTQLELPFTSESIEKMGCGECEKCLNACPAAAIQGKDVEKCREFNKTADRERCTICIDVCPFGGQIDVKKPL
jgi:epoxyqueuosine reductase QueG